MQKEEISLQTLTNNEALHVGYSDDDIVIDGYDAQIGVEFAIHYKTSFSSKGISG